MGEGEGEVHNVILHMKNFVMSLGHDCSPRPFHTYSNSVFQLFMTGCTGSSTYNGKNLDTDPNVKKTRMNVELGCPCRAVLQCRNGGYCVDAAVPFCQCAHGWSGRTCEDIVYVAPVLGKFHCDVP